MDARDDRAGSRLHSEQAARQQISRARVRCKPADGRQRHAGAGVARRRLDSNRGRLLRLLAIRSTCGGALRGAGPLGPVPLDGLGLGEALLCGLVGDRRGRLRRLAARILPRGALVRYREWYGAAGPERGPQDDRRGRGRGDRRTRDSTIPLSATGCSIPRASRRMAGPRSLSGSTRSLLRLVCGHFTPQTIPASRTGGRWGAGISCAPA